MKGVRENQVEQGERGRALLRLRCGFVPRAESGNAKHESRGAAGIRDVLRRLRTGEWRLLSVCRRAGTKRERFTGAILCRKDRTKHTAGRRTFLDARLETGDQGAASRKVILHARIIHGWTCSQEP